MEEERYPGESTGLRLFLEDLSPVVADELGPDSLLHHAIRRALSTHRLAHLRHARQLFNQLPRPVRQRLSTALLAAQAGGGANWRSAPCRGPADQGATGRRGSGAPAGGGQAG